MNFKYALKETVVKKESILEIFYSLSKAKADGCLQISDGSIEYFSYFNKGNLIYSTNSLSPLERLNRNLHRISHTNETLTSEIIQEGINKFGSHLQDSSGIPIDYQSISWFYEQNYIDSEEASMICARIIYEVCESLLSLRSKFYSDFVTNQYKKKRFCQYRISDFINSCQQRIQAWQTFRPQIYSSYQRPLFSFESPGKNNLGLAENQAIFRLLKGLSFRQLAAVIDKDEILLAKILYPSIVNNAIILQGPKPPFDRLPKIPEQVLQIKGNENKYSHLKLKDTARKNNTDIIHKNWKIACIGESNKTQYQINYFLDKKIFSVFSFDNPDIALSKLPNLSPDLILLDLNLEEINRYKLCDLLKNQSQFKRVPILILSQQKVLIDRNKAKLAGADAYLTKPLNRSDLLAMIFKYLNCN